MKCIIIHEQRRADLDFSDKAQHLIDSNGKYYHISEIVLEEDLESEIATIEKQMKRYEMKLKILKAIKGEK